MGAAAASSFIFWSTTEKLTGWRQLEGAAIVQIRSDEYDRRSWEGDGLLIYIQPDPWRHPCWMPKFLASPWAICFLNQFFFKFCIILFCFAMFSLLQVKDVCTDLVKSLQQVTCKWCMKWKKKCQSRAQTQNVPHLGNLKSAMLLCCYNILSKCCNRVKAPVLKQYFSLAKVIWGLLARWRDDGKLKSFARAQPNVPELSRSICIALNGL